MYDLHTHTLLSDGELLPTELIRRAAVLGYETLAITDHADASNLRHLVEAAESVRESARCYGLTLLVGVELTHVPPSLIPAFARDAKRFGADVVVVHGETVVEPVAPPGTNRAACTCEYVDVLGHPGLIAVEDARAAAEHGGWRSRSPRAGGHNRTNGHVARDGAGGRVPACDRFRYARSVRSDLKGGTAGGRARRGADGGGIP